MALDYNKADEYIKAYPKRPFTAFDKDNPKSGITSSSYCRRRTKLLSGKDTKRTININRGIDYTLLDQLFKESPDMTYSMFMEKHPHFKISDAMFYGRRKLIITGKGYTKTKRTYTRSTNSLYMTVWSKPVESLGTVQDVLKDFIETINTTQKLRWELVELKSPACLEIRQRTR
jgi:hypothetical protein